MDLKVCRICGVNEGIFNLFDKTEDVQLSTKLMYCCSNLNIYEGDGLPSVICANCEVELAQAFQFVSKCERTDKLFRSLSLKDDTKTLTSEHEAKVEVKLEDEDYISEHGIDYGEPHDDCTPQIEGNIPIKHEKPVLKCTKRGYKRRVKFKSENSHKCSVCGRQCASPSALTVHMRSHTGETPYPCPNCDKKYKDQGSLSRHIQRNHLQRERSFICESCGKAFFSKNDVKIHMRVHTGETPYACAECPKQFTQISALLRHKKTHTGEKPHKCPTCPKRFPTKNQLKYHARSHSTEKNFFCTICNTAFKYKNNLRKHIMMHTSPNSFICNHCGKRFNLKGNLTIHIKRSHSEKSGYCNVCSKNVSNYEVHMWRHTGQRPLKCELCSSSFFDTKSLGKHVSFRHKNPGKYECGYEGCTMKFPSRPMLEFHTAKVHDHRILYPCDRCSRGFYRKSDLARHKLGTHKERLDGNVS